MIQQLVMASANPKKVAELEELLAAHFEVQPRPANAPETIEDKDTLVGNAVKKATEIAQFTSSVALSDDTGLFVEALDGEPGVFSARYAGEDCIAENNVAKLLANLEGQSNRAAYFETVIALVWPDGTQVLASGQVEGVITAEPRGSSGFGYDPVFEPLEGGGLTFAEMTSDAKAQISHRARALQALVEKLKEND